MEQYLKLTPDDGELLKDPVKYRRLMGRLIYLMVTRPDIAFSVWTLSQYIQTPQKPHWDAAIRVIKYIKGSPGQGLLLPSENNLTLTAYCDSDWGGCQTTWRLVFGYCIFSWFFYYLMEVKITDKRIKIISGSRIPRDGQYLFGDSLVAISVA